MSNDSSVAGPLVPTTSSTLEDDALDDFFQAWVVGITGLQGQHVRPRWQPDPPNLPPRAVTWAAIGVTQRTSDTFPVEQHSADGQGASTLIRHEVLNLLCSFYGPSAQAAAAQLRDGVSIAQNREVLTLAGMGLVSVGDLARAPELVKNQWLNRTDLTVVIRREIRRIYPVLNILSAAASIDADTITETARVSS